MFTNGNSNFESSKIDFNKDVAKHIKDYLFIFNFI